MFVCVFLVCVCVFSVCVCLFVCFVYVCMFVQVHPGQINCAACPFHDMPLPINVCVCVCFVYFVVCVCSFVQVQVQPGSHETCLPPY